MMIPHGIHGSGKSTFQEFNKLVVDPSAALITAFPKLRIERCPSVIEQSSLGILIPECEIHIYLVTTRRLPSSAFIIVGRWKRRIYCRQYMKSVQGSTWSFNIPPSSNCQQECYGVLASRRWLPTGTITRLFPIASSGGITQRQYRIVETEY